MSASTLLEVYLFLLVFALGALAAVAIRYARTHFGAGKHEHEHDLASSQLALPGEPLPPELKNKMLQESEVKFQLVLNHLSSRLNQDLEVSATNINQLVNRLATDIVSGEMEQYRLELGRLRGQADTAMGAISSEIAKHEAEIKAKMAQEIEAEKQVLIKQIDTKLADAVAAFLVETLQHNVDLGNQNAYLISMLEEHKADLVKEVGQDETQPAR